MKLEQPQDLIVFCRCECHQGSFTMNSISDQLFTVFDYVPELLEYVVSRFLNEFFVCKKKREWVLEEYIKQHLKQQRASSLYNIL